MKVQHPFAQAWLGVTAALVPTLYVVFQGEGQEPKAQAPEAKNPAAAPGAAASATTARLDVAGLDALFEAAWAAQGVRPNGLADDAEWLRRATLTLTGTIPTAEEIAGFLADHGKDKRSKKIDDLLARPEYGQHFGGEWERMLVGRGARGQRFDRNAFGEWVVEEFNKNVPFSEFAKAVITASGTPEQNPAVGYIERWQAEPKDLAGQTAKAFLGVQIQCARCHDHKDQQWKQDEFNDFAAYFALTNLRPAGKKMEGKPPILEVVDENEKLMSGMVARQMRKQLEQRMAKKPEEAKKQLEKQALKKVVPSPLRPLTEGPLAMVAEAAPQTEPEAGADTPNNLPETSVQMSRRERLAAWMTASDNPYFARSIANTTFANLLGYGLINPVNDFRSDSKIAIPTLLDALAREFVASGYDYKALVGLLAKSKAFALSSAGDPKEKTEAREANEKIFARFVSRPMSPEQMIDAVTRATGIDEAGEAGLKGMPARKKIKGKKGEESMLPEKAAEMLGGIRNQAVRKFVTVFEDDEQGEDIDFEGTIPQALLMMNSRLVTTAIARGFTVTKAKEQKDGLDYLYLTILGRKPTMEEKSKVNLYIQRGDGVESRATWEDVAWALLNSAEFSTVH